MNVGYLYSSMLFELLRVRRLIVWFVACAALFAMASIFVSLNNMPANELYPKLSGALVFRFLPLVAAIFSMAVLAQEVEQKTVVYVLTRPIPRAQLIAMRTAAAATVTALLTIFAALLISFASYKAGFLSNSLLLKDFMAIVVGAIAYCSLFVSLSLLMNRAMIVCLLFAFGWETVVPNMPGSMYYLSITSYLQAISERPSSGSDTNPLMSFMSGSLGTNMLTPTQGWVVMAITSGALIAFLMSWFTRFEYLPREDAE